MGKKSDLPKSLKEAFRNKPYDIYDIRKYLRKNVGYMGYDVYTVGDRPRKVLRGKNLLNLVIREKRNRRK